MRVNGARVKKLKEKLKHLRQKYYVNPTETTNTQN